MLRSLLGVVDVARDAALAVGAYVGILREHVKAEWATVLGGSFDERVAQAKARMEAHADALEKAEEAGECLEPGQAECRCPSCLDVLQAEQETSQAQAAAAQRIEVLEDCPTEWRVNGDRHRCDLLSGHVGDHVCSQCDAALHSFLTASSDAEASVAARQRTEEARSGETPRPAPGLSTDDEVVTAFIAAEERRGEIAAHLQDALGDNYDWAPSSLPPCAILPFFHDMHADDGTVTPGIHHGFDWDGIVYDLLREFDIRKK